MQLEVQVLLPAEQMEQLVESGVQADVQSGDGHEYENDDGEQYENSGDHVDTDDDDEVPKNNNILNNIYNNIEVSIDLLHHLFCFASFPVFVSFCLFVQYSCDLQEQQQATQRWTKITNIFVH